MPIYELNGKRPTIAGSSYVHPTAVIIGNVTIGEDCWIGPNATIRGDEHAIRIGDGSDVQDNCVIHGETALGPRCRMGHGAIVHGAALGEGVLVAMNAVVLDGVRLGAGVVVAAGSVVAPKAEVAERKVVMGVPGAVVGDLPAGMQRAGEDEDYVAAIPLYRDHLVEVPIVECGDPKQGDRP